MSSDTKADIKTEECGTQENVAKVNDNAASAETPTLSFKDWKTLKDRENNAKEKSKPTKTNKKSKKPIKASGFGKNEGGFNRGQNMQRPQNFFGGNNFGNNGNCGIPPLKPPPIFDFMVSPNNFNGFPNMNFNGNNNFNNFNGGRNMNNNFNGRNMNNNNNFNDCNHFPNGYNNNNFNGRNNFSNGFNNNHNFNGRSNFPNNLNDHNNFPNNFNNNNNNFIGPNLPDSFFATDGIYRQKDLMQRPLSPGENPFRDDRKANELLHKLQNKEFEKPLKNNRPKGSGNAGNKTQRGNKQGAKNSNSFKPKPATPAQNVPKINTAPKIFVPNPRATAAGVVPYIPKPRLPNDHPDMTVEERKKAWKDYREEMKPFRNRDFYNAKRTVQRLSKKDPKELDEKEVERLAAAKEVMKNHKERLAAKYANYIKAEEAATGLGELYLLKKPTPTKDWNKEPPRPTIHEKQFQNYGNFGESQQNFSSVPGRKIVGGYSAFKGFVSGGMLEGNARQGY